MGQKANPIGNRLGIIRGWESNWYGNKKDYSKKLIEDHKIRTYLNARINKGGNEVDRIKEELKKLTGKDDVQINILEIRRPELDAMIVGDTIARQIENRINFKRATKMAIASSLRMGAEGIKIKLSGRLNGAEIARSEWHLQGQLPLHTLRADIDYGLAEAQTTFGQIGVKVWIYRGEILDPKAAMARGTGSDPINETRVGERERRPRTRREREGAPDGRRPRGDNQ